MHHTGCGLEPWTIASGVPLSRWDLWYLTVLVEDCSGSWDTLAARVKAELGPYEMQGFAGRDWESKRTHLQDLRARIERHRLDPTRLLRPRKDDRRILYKARQKLFKNWVSDRDKTPAMLRTPRTLLEADAMRGEWSHFPVSPTQYERVYKSWVTRDPLVPHEMDSLGLASRLEEQVKRAAKPQKARAAEQLALYRAGLTALIEWMDYTDDSYGAMGDLFDSILSNYLAVPWATTGLPPDIYYRDLLNLLTWEDYGFTHRKLGHFFRSIPAEDVPRVEAILGEIREGLLQVRGAWLPGRQGPRTPQRDEAGEKGRPGTLRRPHGL